MFKAVLRWLGRRPWWAVVLGTGLSLLAALNLTVAWVGDTVVFPFSPFFLSSKCKALLLYAAHRPRCLWQGHGDMSGMISAAARRHRLPKGLLESVVQVESAGKAHRIS